jgi:hypothetical protein
MTTRTRWLGGVALAGVAITVLVVAADLVRRDGDTGDGERPAPAMTELAALRASIAACQAEIAAEQERFEAHEARVDSLRDVVTAWESDERTVPADEFAGYLDAFDAYNRSVSDWHDRAAALRAAWDGCRDLTERHNALVDSLSARPGGGAGPPAPGDAPPAGAEPPPDRVG